jgi:hypothetical protein
MELKKHSGQTQAQFDAIIANNYVNRVQANWPKATPPRPSIVGTRHFSTGDGNIKSHSVEFNYEDGSQQVFDGNTWKKTRDAVVPGYPSWLDKKVH